MACLAPEIAGQTSNGQLCWGDCALGWPVWIRGALLSVTQGCLCVPAAAAGKLAFERERKEAERLRKMCVIVTFVLGHRFKKLFVAF